MFLIHLTIKTVLRIIYNIERLRERTLEPSITGGRKLEGKPDLKGGTSDPSSYHVVFCTPIACTKTFGFSF